MPFQLIRLIFFVLDIILEKIDISVFFADVLKLKYNKNKERICRYISNKMKGEILNGKEIRNSFGSRNY